MTPEERFTKIENYLSALTEHQVRHAEEIQELREMHKEHAEEIQELRAMHKSMVVAISKLAEAQRVTDAQQKITEEQLRALIKRIDRITRRPSEN